MRVVNADLYKERKQLRLIEASKELPSPVPRVVYNLRFMSNLHALTNKYFPESQLIDVSNTNSMEPTIDQKNKILILPFDEEVWYQKKETLEVGDIILFKRTLDNTNNVLHRIVAKKGNNYVLTRGDNTVRLDGGTMFKNIHGVCGGVLY